MFAVIYIPNFSLQSVLRLEPELQSRAVALVVSESTKAKATVMQLTRPACERGVAEGLTASQAVARCGNLIIRHRSPAQEKSVTEILLQIAGAFSPCIESTALGVCTMELKGLSLKNQPIMRQWASKILTALTQFQLNAQMGFASTPGLALILARAADPILLTDDPRQFAAALPMEALHPPPEIAGILRLWGIRTIGAFLTLGRNNLAERLGPDAAALFDTLDLVRPLNIVSPPETFAERMEFEHEIETTEPLLFVLTRMLEQLTRRLEGIYLAVARLELQLTLSSDDKYTRTFDIPSPTNNLQVLFRILQTHLETLRTGSPIISLQLQAQPANLEQHQFGLFETTLRDPNQFAETLARLTALCGSQSVGTPHLQATHRPDAFHMTVPDFSKPTSCLRDASRIVNHAQTGMQLRRFRPALAAIIEFREHQPALIRSHACNGAVNATRGPFLASGDWWDARAWSREEWDVQMMDGALYRIFRSPDGCFVEGVYD
jgi:protein ImuB